MTDSTLTRAVRCLLMLFYTIGLVYGCLMIGRMMP